MHSVWLANQADNLTHYSFSNNQVQRYLEGKNIGIIYPKDKNRFLVTTVSGGWFLLDVAKDSIQPFELSNEIEKVNISACRAFIPGNKKNYIWTNDVKGIVKINLKTGRIQKWPTYRIYALARLNDSLLVYGTAKKNFWIFNTHTKESRMLVKDRHSVVKSMVIHDGIIYAGTTSGLLQYNYHTRTYAYHRLPEEERQKREDNGLFTSLIFKPDMGLIVGTYAGYLYHYDVKTHQYRALFHAPKGAAINSMFYDDKERLWLATEQGLFAWDSHKDTALRFSTIDDFSNNYFSKGSLLKTKQGVFLGTRQGLNYFNPDSIHPFQYEGQIVPLAMVEYNEDTKELDTLFNRHRLSEIRHITLSIQNRFLQLDFGMANQSVSDLKFKYRLDGKKWVPIELGHYVRFENLTPGNYNLQIAAFDTYDKIIGNPLEYSLKVQDFFFKRWWFLLLLIIVVVFIVGLIIFSSEQKKRLNLERKSTGYMSAANKNLQDKLDMEHHLVEERKIHLEEKKREIVASSLRLANVNNSIRSVIKESLSGASLGQVRRKLKLILAEEEDWDFFMKKFIEVHPEFMDWLKKRYPQLTPNDLRFCALLKLKISNKEIATLLNISHQSVLSKRYRLRKKMGMTKEKDRLGNWL